MLELSGLDGKFRCLLMQWEDGKKKKRKKGHQRILRIFLDAIGWMRTNLKTCAKIRCLILYGRHHYQNVAEFNKNLKATFVELSNAYGCCIVEFCGM